MLISPNALVEGLKKLEEHPFSGMIKQMPVAHLLANIGEQYAEIQQLKAEKNRLLELLELYHSDQVEK